MKKEKLKNSCKILVANGVNLDLLGMRQPEIYGSKTLKDLEKYILDFLPFLNQISVPRHIEIEFFQSNCEGAFLESLNSNWDGIIINPGAWTHTSLALADRLVAIQVPFIEVHLSNVHQREKFRQKSFISKHALGVVCGLGFDSYTAGLLALARKIN